MLDHPDSVNAKKIKNRLTSMVVKRNEFTQSLKKTIFSSMINSKKSRKSMSIEK